MRLINVYICRSNGHYTQFYAEGHANYAERGKDIVCAAVSALTLTLYNSLMELSDVPVVEKQYACQKKPNLLIPYPSDKTDLLISQYKIGIEGVQEAFPNYVTLHFETS